MGHPSLNLLLEWCWLCKLSVSSPWSILSSSPHQGQGCHYEVVEASCHSHWCLYHPPQSPGVRSAQFQLLHWLQCVIYFTAFLRSTGHRKYPEQQAVGHRRGQHWVSVSVSCHCPSSSKHYLLHLLPFIVSPCCLWSQLSSRNLSSHPHGHSLIFTNFEHFIKILC